MKVLALVLLASPLSALAFNCPNLAGKYTCPRLLPDVNVTQVITSGVTTYTFEFDDPNQGTWILEADGKEHDIQAPDIQDGKYTATCQSPGLNLDTSGTILMPDKKMAFSVSYLFQNHANKLYVEQWGKIDGNPIPREIDLCNRVKSAK